MDKIIVEARLRDDEEFLAKCVLLLHGLQEGDEQSDRTTHHRNKVGFNKSDAQFLTATADDIKELGVIPAQYRDKVVQRMLKYSSQLSNLIEDDG